MDLQDPTPDIPLLRKTLEWAEAEAAKPEEECGWYQPSYIKHTHNGNGRPLAFLSKGNNKEHNKSPEINGCGTAFCIAGYVYWQGTGRNDVHEGSDAAVYAREALGLTYRQAEDLFSGGNTIEQVRAIMEKIAGEKL